MLTTILIINFFILCLLAHVVYNHNQKLFLLKEEMLSITHASADIMRDHAALVTADLVFAKQVKEISKQLVSMDNQLQGLANIRQNDGGYQHALRILKMGGDREEIINSCHLSPAEADLLVNMHAYSAVLDSSK